MDAIDLLRYQIRQCYAWLEMTVGDITHKQAIWQPPGVANSIGAVYAHLVITADFDVNSRLCGDMPISASEFRGEFGVSEMQPAGFDWHDWPQVSRSTGQRYMRTAVQCGARSRRASTRSLSTTCRRPST